MQDKQVTDLRQLSLHRSCLSVCLCLCLKPHAYSQCFASAPEPVHQASSLCIKVVPQRVAQASARPFLEVRAHRPWTAPRPPRTWLSRRRLQQLHLRLQHLQPGPNPTRSGKPRSGRPGIGTPLGGLALTLMLACTSSPSSMGGITRPSRLRLRRPQAHQAHCP